MAACPGGIIARTEGHPGGGGGGGIRGLVYGWSRASRRRFREVAAHIPVDRQLHYEIVTLTYHRAQVDPSEAHIDLHHFVRGLERDYADQHPGVIWNQEYQDRGSPHFHLLIQLDASPGRPFIEYVAREWNRIAEPGDEKALRAGTRAEPLRTRRPGGIRQVMAYITRYAGKENQKRRIDPRTGESLHTGRMWGKTRGFTLEELATFTLSEAGRVQLARRIRRWMHRSWYGRQIGKRFPGYLIFGEPSAFAQLLRGLPGLDENPLASYLPSGP